VFRPALPIDTKRLTLRAYTDDDLKALYDIRCRPDVTRYLLFEPQSLDEVRESLDRRIKATELNAPGDPFVLAVERKDTGELAGDVNLEWRSEPNKLAELGYIFHPRHGGQGFAREAAAAMLRLAFEEFGMHRVVAHCDARNLASINLLKKLGMRLEAHFVRNEFLKGEWTDELVFAMLEVEWAHEIQANGALS